MLLWILCSEAIPHSSCYLTSIVDKTHHESVIARFSVQTSAAFLATSEVFTVIDCGYSANFNIRGAFAIIFLIGRTATEALAP